MVTPLRGLRVVQGSGGIEVAYCTKILADAGADVVVLEGAGGHWLRRRQVAPPTASGPDGALFDYLHAGKGSVGEGADLASLFDRADVLVTDSMPVRWGLLHERHPGLTVVAVTPFGLASENRPARGLDRDVETTGLDACVKSRYASATSATVLH